MIFQPFKQAMTGSKFEYIGVLSNDKSDFKDSSTLLDQIDKLLQIFARCRAYNFYIESHNSVNYSTHVLAAILRFDAIIRCPKIGGEFNFGRPTPTQTRLPTEAIENWLNRAIANGQEDNERVLKLEIHDAIPNLSGMLEYLKKVVIFVKLL